MTCATCTDLDLPAAPKAAGLAARLLTALGRLRPAERLDLESLSSHRLRDLGLTQGQNFDLEDLAADCADDGRWTFLLEASPIPFTGAVGSPVNPVAVK